MTPIFIHARPEPVIFMLDRCVEGASKPPRHYFAWGTAVVSHVETVAVQCGDPAIPALVAADFAIDAQCVELSYH